MLSTWSAIKSQNINKYVQDKKLSQKRVSIISNITIKIIYLSEKKIKSIHLYLTLVKYT